MASPKCIPVEHVVAQLCPQCGLCCNGVLFKDVELQSGDNCRKLASLGLPISKKPRAKFPQPCAALDGCNCEIYRDRPARCRQFECALLKSVSAGETSVGGALRLIGQTQKSAANIKELLRELGDHDEHRALNHRFAKTKRKFESGGCDVHDAGTMSRLTLAVHDLNLLLRRNFYPG